MNYWIMKSEPDVFSYDNLVEKGSEHWDGVRNYQARNNLKAMKKGDYAFFYHSNIGKEIVGILKIQKEHYPDPTTNDERWVCVDVIPYKKLKKPITLQQLKEHTILQNIALVKHSRLSVIPISKIEFDLIVELGK